MGVKLFLIRHGQTELNLEGRYEGSMDTELTSVEYPEPSQGFEGATVWFDVTYRVKESDPYTRI